MAFPLGKAVILFYLLLIFSLGSSSDDRHTNHDGIHVGELRLIRQEIGQLREENKKQNTEILTLKETVKLQNKTITMHEITMKELDEEIKKSFNSYKNNDSSEKEKRNKRAARLLPLRLLFDRDYDDDDRTTKKPPPRKFLGPPTNCSDLARLGYTLNGYYLVQHNYTETTTKYSYHSGNNNATDTVYCAFKQEGVFNPSLVEQKLALSPPLNKKIIEELNQNFAKNGNLDKSNLKYTTEKERDEDILELKQEMAQLRHIVKSFRSLDSYIGTPYTSTVVCFVVEKLTALANSSQLAGSSVVKFEEEVLNLGDSFHLKESIFIAPKDGVYEFIFTGYKRGYDKEHVLKVSLRLNGKEVVNSFAEELTGSHKGLDALHNYRCPISMHSLLKLKKGDRVDVISSEGALHDHDSRFPIHFSGKLLFDEDIKGRNQKLPDAVYFVLQKNRTGFNTTFFYKKNRTGFNTTNSSVPFEVESLNVGGAIVVRKNAFIAPVSGVYEFSLKGYKTVKTRIAYIYLRVNGKPIAASWCDTIDFHDHHTPFSINSILQLKEGDVIDLHLKNGQIYDDDNQYTTFTGKLLLMDYQPPESSFNNTNLTFDSLAVFFYVQRTNSFNNYRYKVVPFENIVLNVGEAFNMSDSTFIAPRAGIYEFSFAGIKTTQDYQQLSVLLRLNGHGVTYASADAATTHPFRTPIFFHSILRINKGDRVDILLEKGGIYAFGEPHIHFTGKLLFAVDNEKKTE